MKAHRYLYNQKPNIQTLLLYIHTIPRSGADEPVGSDSCKCHCHRDEADGLILYELKSEFEDCGGVFKKVCSVMPF